MRQSLAHGHYRTASASRLHKGTPATNKRFLGRLILDVSAHNRTARPVSPTTSRNDDDADRRSSKESERDAQRFRSRDADRDADTSLHAEQMT